MIVVVTGTRQLVSRPDVVRIKDRFVTQILALQPLAIFHGGAYGPDTWAAHACPEISVSVRPPYNSPNPIQALFDRNKTMVNQAIAHADDYMLDLVMVTCWNGNSSGTRDAFEYAESKGVNIVHTLEKPR